MKKLATAAFAIAFWMTVCHALVTGIAAFTSWDITVMYTYSSWPDAGRFFYACFMLCVAILGLNAVSEAWDDL